MCFYTLIGCVFNPAVSFPMLPQVLCPALVCTHGNVELSQSCVGCCVDGEGCLWRMLPPEAKSLCLPSNYFHITNSYMYIPWRESLVSCTLGFLRKEKNLPAWSRPFEGFKVPWRNAALNRRRQVQLIPGKLRAYQGFTGPWRGEGRISGWNPRPGSWRFPALLYLPWFLGRGTVTEVCGGQWGTWLAKHKPHIQNGNSSKESLLFSCWIYRNLYILLGWGMQEPPTFYMISVCSTQGYWCYFFSEASPRKRGWLMWLPKLCHMGFACQKWKTWLVLQAFPE